MISTVNKRLDLGSTTFIGPRHSKCGLWLRLVWVRTKTWPSITMLIGSMLMRALWVCWAHERLPAVAVKHLFVHPSQDTVGTFYVGYILAGIFPCQNCWCHCKWALEKYGKEFEMFLNLKWLPWDICFFIFLFPKTHHGWELYCLIYEGYYWCLSLYRQPLLRHLRAWY